MKVKESSAHSQAILFFLNKTTIKNETSSAINFPLPSITVFSMFFKISTHLFCCIFITEEYVNPQVRIDKMINDQGVNYHPSPLELLLRIFLLDFLKISQSFVSPQSFCEIF